MLEKEKHDFVIELKRQNVCLFQFSEGVIIGFYLLCEVVDTNTCHEHGAHVKVTNMSYIFGAYLERAK